MTVSYVGHFLVLEVFDCVVLLWGHDDAAASGWTLWAQTAAQTRSCCSCGDGNVECFSSLLCFSVDDMVIVGSSTAFYQVQVWLSDAPNEFCSSIIVSDEHAASHEYIRE